MKEEPDSPHPLREIISSNIARDYFETFLAGHPTSEHPLDQQRRAVAIHAIARWQRKPIDLYQLRIYLRSLGGWNDDEAIRCVDYIDSGLQFIKHGREFRRQDRTRQYDVVVARFRASQSDIE